MTFLYETLKQILQRLARSARHDQRLLDRHRNDLILYNANALSPDSLHQEINGLFSHA